MPLQTPDPGQDDELAATPAGGQPWFARLTGGADADPAAVSLDWQALLEALAAGGFLDGDPDGQDAAVVEQQDAAEDGRMSAPLPPAALGAMAAEHMVPGPAQAGWLAAATADSGLDENALTGVAITARQLASWAQAVELGAVAGLAARTAAADPNIGLKPDGRPARLCRDATGQISLALMLTEHAATAWAGLAITLAWRLPTTRAALAGGRIDLARAKVIAEATSVLAQDAARAVEAAVVPGAGQQTCAQLRARLRTAVIAADPGAAEQRRHDAERCAAVSLYGDDDGTATLAGTGLPAVQAAAAMARITAIARAMKAAGHGGGLDLHRAQVMLGLLLGTLPYIPPPGGSPEPPPPDDPGPGSGPGSSGGPGDGSLGDRPDGHGPGAGPGGGRDDDRPGSDDGIPDDRPGPRGQDAPADDSPSAGEPSDDPPAPRDEDGPAGDGLDEDGPAGDGLDEDGDDSPAGPAGPGADDEEDWPGTGPVPPWPDLGAIPPALGRPAASAGGRPPAGLLDVTLPWATLAGLSFSPGLLGRIGPITADQARRLARAAATDPAAQWRIIVTNPAGQALAAARIPHRARGRPGRPGRPGRTRDGPASPDHHLPPGAGLVGRITLTITQDAVRQHTLAGTGPAAGAGPPDGIVAAALRAATRALDRAQAQAAADAAAGGCAHAGESPAYQPPPRLREHVIARDVTCRNPACRQPAWRADLDHTRPWDHGGRTCACNLGGACRRHHQLKQHPRWKLDQTRPGEFTWTTPAGRTYTASPDTHPV